MDEEAEVLFGPGGWGEVNRQPDRVDLQQKAILAPTRFFVGIGRTVVVQFNP